MTFSGVVVRTRPLPEGVVVGLTGEVTAVLLVVGLTVTVVVEDMVVVEVLLTVAACNQRTNTLKFISVLIQVHKLIGRA